MHIIFWLNIYLHSRDGAADRNCLGAFDTNGANILLSHTGVLIRYYIIFTNVHRGL
jgi:hypothetical protein